MTSRSLRHRAPLLWLVLPLMAGLAAGRAGTLATPGVLLAGALVAALAALAAARRAPAWWAVPLALSLFLTGSASYALHRHRLADWDGLPPREARLSLRLDRVFPGDDVKKISGLATVAGTTEPLRELAGQRVYFSLAARAGEPPLIRSAVMSAVGVISAVPRDAAANSFDGYLDSAGIGFKLARGRVLALEQPATAYQQFCARLAARMNALLGAGLEDRPDLAAIYRAMLLGQKHDLSDEQRDLFMHSGTMHLFAINGLHIAVVALALHSLLALLRCPRLPASLLVLAVLWLDVDITGASPSAVRAFLMVAMVEAAWALWQPANPFAALAAAALLVLALDPLDFFSARFRMSYGVITAILAFGLPLTERMKERWPAFQDLPKAAWQWHHHGRAWARRKLLDLLGLGCAATLVSLVTGVEYFGVVVTGALAANLVLVPLAVGVITVGFASLVLGLAGVAWAGRLCNEAAGLLLRLIGTLIRLGTAVPGASWPAQYRAEWIGPAALTALVASLLAGYGWGWRRERGGWWPPVAVVALTLIFGVKYG